MIKLRPYQEEAIECIKECFKNWFRQYIEMPTGSGKTITFLSYAAKYHKRILIIVPSIQLMDQVYETCLLFYHKSQISRKGNRNCEYVQDIHICTIQSIRGDYLIELAEENFDLTIIDEAHHTQSESYKRFIKERGNHWHEREMLILGATATPDRMDGLLIKDIIGTCSYSVTISDLIQKNFLVDLEGYSTKTGIDLSDIDHHNGDYSLNHLFRKLCTDSRNKMILDICKENMLDRKTIIFCINIEHSKQINKLLNTHGLASAHIDGTMNQDVKHAILQSFRNGEISFLCNCQLLTEGFDEPSIDGVVIARPTKSYALFTQMIGRGLRLSPGKSNCKIIDIVDAHKNRAGFNSLIDSTGLPDIESFKSIKDISEHVISERIKVTEYSIERIDLMKRRRIDDVDALDCMIEDLERRGIYYQHPISFDEASFLIWFDELKKELYGYDR